jgi:hypothetical protein
MLEWSDTLLGCPSDFPRKRRAGIYAAPFRTRPDASGAGAAETPLHRPADEAGRDGRESEMRKILEIGGVVAAAVLIGFGVVALVLGVNGRSTVRDSIKQEKIVGSGDMTPAAIAKEAADAKLPASIALPTCSVAGKAITNGTSARCFAQYMRIHTLEATGGYTYSQMGRFQAKPDTPKAQLAVGGGTDNADWAVVDTTTKQPVANGARNIWVTETALTTALNSSYMADQLSLFSVVVGVALLLSGLGFGILALGGALRSREAVVTQIFGKLFPKSGRTHAPTA